jgi:cell division protein ZipA
MFTEMSDTMILRIIIAAAFVLLMLVIVLSSKKKPKQAGTDSAVRIEPHATPEQGDDAAPDERVSVPQYAEQADLGFDTNTADRKHSTIGVRKTESYEKIIMLYMAAKSGQTISGAELVLATEKVGLVFGHHNIYHRLAESAHSNEPVFSMANVLQPGYFDLGQIDSLQTPGVSFFMTLPGPLTAMQAWDTMLPIAERMAQLLDAVLLDSDRNALGRQRIQHIKEELRAFDREQERQTIIPGR